MQRSRREIVNILKRDASATLDHLAKSLGLVPVTVRAHLSVLERDGYVTSEEVRGRVARPYFVYSLTEKAEELFPKPYDALTVRILESLQAIGGQEVVDALFAHMGEHWATDKMDRMAGKTFDEKVSEVATIRTEEGALAEYVQEDGNFKIIQHNCPVIQIANQYPQVCNAELTYLKQLLGADLERVNCFAQGDHTCDYIVHTPKPEDQLVVRR